jgi:hypothetical protein
MCSDCWYVDVQVLMELPLIKWIKEEQWFVILFIVLKGVKTSEIMEEWQSTMAITVWARSEWLDLKEGGWVLMMHVLGGQ